MRRYLRATWRVIASFILMAALLHVCVYFSSPLAGAWADMIYIDSLLLAVGAACLAVGFFNYRSRHRRIIEALKRDEPMYGEIDRDISEPDVELIRDVVQHEYRAFERERIRLLTEIADHRDLLTRWAHDVKTPLSVSELILNRDEAQPVRTQLERELYRIRFQVEHVLHAERLNHIEQSLILARVELAPIVRAAVIRNMVSLRARNLEVELNVGTEHGIIDEQCLSYILDQLLSNASKYAEEGTSVAISAQQDGAWTLLNLTTVSEIPEGELGRVFDKGFSGASAKKRAAPTGMGLYYADRTARAMGCRLSAQSEGGITCFTIKIPNDKNVTFARDLSLEAAGKRR